MLLPLLVFFLNSNQDSGEGLVEVLVSHVSVMPWWVMLCEVIGHVCSFAPESNLLDSVLDPVEVHVERFGEFLVHCRVEDACGG